MSAEQPASPRVRSAKGSMLISSLRPGDWLMMALGYRVVVTINSPKKRRFVVRFGDGIEKSYRYDFQGSEDQTTRFIGHSPWRRWWAFLPKCLKRRICPFQRLAK